MDARRLTRELRNALRSVGERAADLPPAERAAIETRLKDIAAGVRFTQQLNDFSAICQIPLLLNNQKTTTELFVFNDNPRQKKIDPKNATLFLSLGTAHMGRVETFVKVIGKNIECDFALEDGVKAAYARESVYSLGAVLESIGYFLTRSAFSEQSEATSGPLAVEESREQFMKRYRFDRQV
jgi:hypothetical protein